MAGGGKRRIRRSRVLVPVDGSEPSFRAASKAIKLAKMLDSEIILLHVVSIPRYAALFGWRKKFYAEALKEAERWFSRIKREADREGVTVRTRVIRAMFSITGMIVNFASKNRIDLIVLGTRGRTGFKETLLGSVASGVATYAPCSVLVVR